MTHRSDAHRTGENHLASGRVRCTFCTIANTAVGLLIGVAPVLVPLLTGRAELAIWGLPLTLIILGYTAHRVIRTGHLPGADRVAHATGLSRVVGPDEPAPASDTAPQHRKGGSDDEQC
ncbi:hypothetical protein [Haloechinothrix halophila]|uniref:hypothetical protein n=1 Tax=Haloechinothrix halophila TaxID=1069073 RepID=UPI00055887EF|nr:hypothetical protein [Haloechinothrix halophila]